MLGDVSDVRRFLRMTNQLSKFILNLADMTKPLRYLLCKSCPWTWQQPQQQAFDNIKKLLSRPPVLARCDPNATTIVLAEASTCGLETVLLQEQEDGDLNLISYISRSMYPTEEHCAQIKRGTSFYLGVRTFFRFLVLRLDSAMIYITGKIW